MTSQPVYDLTSARGLRERDADTTRRRIPPAFRDADASDPRVIAWCDALAATAAGTGSGTMPSLLITGPTGVGKTWQAYGAIRRITAAVPVPWLASTAADLYGRLRPGDGRDTEAELARWCRTPLLMVDDLAAAKDSAWTEDIDYRLVNYRSAHLLPSIFTTNLPVRGDGPSLESALSERVFSRLATSRVVVLKGADRRRTR